MRVAITHDWLTEVGGPERVLEQLLRMYPGAHVYTSLDHLPVEHRGVLLEAPVFTSSLQKLPRAARTPRTLLPLLPLAMERFDLCRYDLIISNTRAAAKLVKKRPGQIHIGYMSSANRFRWDLQLRHLEEQRPMSRIGGRVATLLLDYLRVADEAGTARVDRIVAASGAVGARLSASYRRPADVIHPPINVDFWSPLNGLKRDDFFLSIASQNATRRRDPVVEAFSSMPQRKLVVAGSQAASGGPGSNAGANIEFLELESDEALRELMRRARAFVHAAPDELGMVLAEAQACGLPVVTLARGTALELVRGLDDYAPSGIFFDDRRPASIIDGVERFEREKYRIYSAACRESAIRFRPEAFRARFSALVSRTVAESGYLFRSPLLQVVRETEVSCRMIEQMPWGIEEALDAVEATVDVYV